MFAFSSGCGKIYSPQPNNPLETISFLAYQIQNQHEGSNLQTLINSHYDLLIVDHTRSIIGEENYDSKADVTLLKNSTNSSGGKKIVVCYIDVGEAESYRWYWQGGWEIGNPDWIVAEDPDGWDENYPVKFWKDEWLTIMKQFIDRVIEDGYDGIYLDWLEVYSFTEVASAAQNEGIDPKSKLIEFVGKLRDYALSKKSDFIMIAQNAAELGDSSEYVNLFDAIAQEAIWFDGAGDPDTGEQPGDVAQDTETSNNYINNLEKWQQLGKPIFNIEYAQNSSNVAAAYQLGKKNNYKTYVSLRLLNSLTQTPPPEY